MTTYSQLTLCNAALRLCGETPFNAANDGSPEWLMISAAYDKGLNRLLADHNWKFAKTIVAVEDRADPDDPNWEDAYDRPSGAVHITRVMDADGNELTDWAIFGTKIHVNEDAGLLVEYIADKDPSTWPNFFSDVIFHFLFSAIYRGPKQQPDQARAEENSAEKLLMRARPRIDQEEPPKARHISSLAAARRRQRG